MYDNSLFENGHGHVLVYRPTPEPPRSGRVHPVTLPAVELAVTTHVGEHDDIDVTYGELGAWVVANALAVAGPLGALLSSAARDTGAVTAVAPSSAGRVLNLPAPDGGASPCQHLPFSGARSADLAVWAGTLPPSTPFRHVK